MLATASSALPRRDKPAISPGHSRPARCPLPRSAETALLSAGLQDVLPPEAAHEAASIDPTVDEVPQRCNERRLSEIE